ncbi:hypothetical protein RhiirA1_533093 [Rhizophagus irregularis]|uniref:Uncharacterized protein n=1 Tax=Rhizophagus irregularis TaxID=588596 RepID=A0A2N0S2Z2_9GLOM|nr:hypothetical protein RhiirA1_533093 [Rhizophagus irregularis]
MKKSNNNTRGRGRGGVQHVLPSNIFTTQSSNSNTSVFNESQHSFSMPSNPNNSFDQNINYLNNNLQNIHLNSTPNAEIQNLPNIQAIHSLPDPIQNPQTTKRTKRTTCTQELSFLEPLVNDTSEENINNAIQQLNNWNIANNQTENMWDRQRVIKWVQTRTRDNRLTREKRERNN